MENKTWLTEKGLLPILKEIFPNEEIRTQVVVGNRRMDYSIKLNKDHPFCRFLETATNSKIKTNIELYVEYDGDGHYTRNSQVLKDLQLTNNELCFGPTKIHSELYIIRIPYWMQLDSSVSKFMFGIDKDYSNNFPQGFISQYCITPDRFCVSGEMRFIEEMARCEKILPGVFARVIQSLKDKNPKNNQYSINLNKLIVQGNNWKL